MTDTETLAECVQLSGDAVGEPDRTAVQRLAEAMTTHRHSQIDAVFRATTSAERVQLWCALLTGLGSVPGVDLPQTWRLFVQEPGAMTRWLDLNENDDQRWAMFVELYEAWYRIAVNRAVPGVSDREAAAGVGYLARTRWRLLSAPFRTATADIDPDGVDSPVEDARQAREDWLSTLVAIDDHPALARAIDVEDETAGLVDVEVRKSALEKGAVGDPARPAITGYVVTRFLLPRFAWRDSYRALRQVFGSRVTVHLYTVAAFFAAALVVFLIGAFRGGAWGYTVAAVAAVLGYIAIGVGAMVAAELSWLWLLRQAAGSAVGLLALTALPADWWWQVRVGQDHRDQIWSATILLVVVGFGYLMIEAANHGVTGWALVLRSLLVGGSGFAHAFLVSVIALRTIVPAFAAVPQGTGVRLSCWWTAHGCGPAALSPWLIVLTAAAWSFVVGVFLQILWDDQPITAPLAHVRWRKGG